MLRALTVAVTILTLSIVTTPHVARAQDASSPPPYTPPSRRIAPGDTSLRAAKLRPDTLTYDLMAFRDASAVSVGTIVDVLTRSTEGVPQLRRVLSVQRSAAALIDSTITDAGTMAPRQHRSYQPTRKMRIDIAGMRVRGTLGPMEGPGVAIDTTLSTPFFDSGNWDLIVRAMPLAPGFAAVFRVYDLDTGLKDYTVRVVGATTMYGEAAHVVLFRLGAGSEATVWIGAESRRLLQVETPLGATTLLRQTLRAPAPR